MNLHTFGRRLPAKPGKSSRASVGMLYSQLESGAGHTNFKTEAVDFLKPRRGKSADKIVENIEL